MTDSQQVVELHTYHALTMNMKGWRANSFSWGWMTSKAAIVLRLLTFGVRRKEKCMQCYEYSHLKEAAICALKDSRQ